jgi:hypothetical protein
LNKPAPVKRRTHPSRAAMPNPLPATLKVSEAARVFRCGENEIRRRIKTDKQFPVIRCGKKNFLIPTTPFLAYINSCGGAA